MAPDPQPARSRPPLIEVPVAIQSQDGHGGERGMVTFARPGLGRRLLGAGVCFLIGLGVGVLLLPVPLIHLFGVMFFLGMSGLALKRLATGRVLKSAWGRCPSCHAEQALFVGLGGRRAKFPVATTCPACHVGLDLFPLASGAQ
jgi:hypothetical protein